MQGRKQMAGRKGLSQSLKNTGMMNYQESKKLNSSVDKFKKEFEKKVRNLSVQQSVLLASQRKRDSRRGSLPSTPSIDFEDDIKRSIADETLKSSFSDSALDQCKDLRSGVNTDNRPSSSTTPSPLKLPSIATHKEKTGSRKIELEVTSIKTPKEMIFDKLKYSRQAKPAKLDAKDMTTKLSNGYSAMILASPPITRSNRRGSLQATHLSPLSLEDPVPNRTGIRLMRRGSCPNLGAKTTVEKKLAGMEISNGDSLEDQTSKFSRHVQEMKKCRYLRFPTSPIREDEEENIDSVFNEK